MATQKPPSSESTGFSLSTILSKFGSHDTAKKSHDTQSHASDEEIDGDKEIDVIPIPGSSMESDPSVVSEPNTASPQISVLQRMQLPGSMEERDSGNGTLEVDADDIVVRVSKGSRQRRSKVKHRRRKSKNRDTGTGSLKAVAHSSSEVVADSETTLLTVDDTAVASGDDVDVPVPVPETEPEPSVLEVLEPELESVYESETRSRSNAVSNVEITQEAQTNNTELTNQLAAGEDVPDTGSTPSVPDEVKLRPPTTPDHTHFDSPHEEPPELPSNQSAAPPTRQRAATDSSGECEHRISSSSRSNEQDHPLKPHPFPPGERQDG